MAPVYAHMGGSFKKKSSKARQVEAKRARFFARRKAFSSQNTTLASGWREEGGSDENARPPLDLLPLRAGDESLEGDATDGGEAETMVTPPKPKGAAHASAAEAPRGSMPYRLQLDDDLHAPQEPRASLPTVMLTPPRAGGSQAVNSLPGKSNDAFTRCCYQNLEPYTPLFVDEPYELNSEQGDDPILADEDAAPRPHVEYDGVGLLEEPEMLDLGLDGAEQRDAAYAAGSFHRVIVQHTYHWRSADTSPFPTPMRLVGDSPIRWLQSPGGEQQPSWLQSHHGSPMLGTDQSPIGGGRGHRSRQAHLPTFAEIEEETEDFRED
ncbi:hypothetical protein T492DRAFT_919071 [Pavlovales sp. CCMP2436]|nr:hypothetical protein T492DRAFT_919071 [Pavlovales sp. CCMP2436]